MTIENISRSISSKVWDQARIRSQPLDLRSDSLQIAPWGPVFHTLFSVRSEGSAKYHMLGMLVHLKTWAYGLGTIFNIISSLCLKKS